MIFVFIQISFRYLSLVLLTFVISCGGYDGPIKLRHLTIQERTDERITGYFEAHNSQVDFDAIKRPGGSYTAVLMLQEKELWADLIYNADSEYEFRLEGSGGPLKLEEIALFRFFAEELNKLNQTYRLSFSQLPLQEQVLAKFIEYMGSVPENYQQEKMIFKWKDQIEQTADWVKDRLNPCVYHGDIVQGIFTDKNGKTIDTDWTEIDIVNSARGRCGDGLTSTGWTKDCVNHDLCHNHFKRLGEELPAGLGPHCLDEFQKAVDDFFFSRMWGCRG
jgi:hypothetical protein